MRDPDQMLQDLWAADEPPARDHRFTMTVMEEAARRRFRRDLLALIPLALAAVVALWAVEPQVMAMARSLPAPDAASFGPLAGAVLLAAWLLFWMSGRQTA